MIFFEIIPQIKKNKNVFIYFIKKIAISEKVIVGQSVCNLKTKDINFSISIYYKAFIY